MEGMSTLPGSLFHHVYRQANAVAHCIARYALLTNSCSSWGSLPLDFLAAVILKDFTPST